jgi:hypothetical protein
MKANIVSIPGIVKFLIPRLGSQQQRGAFQSDNSAAASQCDSRAKFKYAQERISNNSFEDSIRGRVG